eukprot:TRINITY_DN17450_c0_g1_i1.p1 TRINITY_DN17450_c0_g1~~TRINITY_DN17450_c0_g1_i1.p1  ORF type:complete len:487 (+),score=92.43 TRINITY_DN17450_c0_g1_i1:226-1686(+)
MAIFKGTARRTRVTTNAPPKNNRQSSPSSVLRNRADSDSDQSKEYTVISDTSSEGPELELEAEDEAGELQELDTWLKNGAPGWKLLALVFCCGAFLGLLLLSALGGDRWAFPSSVQSTGVERQGGRNLPSPTFGPDGRPTWYGRIKPKQMVATPREAIQWAAKESLWEKVSSRVAIAVRTDASTAAHRLPVLHATWLQESRIPNLLIVSDKQGPGVPPGAKLASKLLKKVGGKTAQEEGAQSTFLPALRLLHETFPTAETYLVVDDDAYLMLENVAKVLLSKLPNAKTNSMCLGRGYLVTGCGGMHDSGVTAGKTNPMFPQGDAGFVLSRKSLELVAPFLDGCMADFTDCWAGDMRVGLCLNRAGVPFDYQKDNSMGWFFPGTLSQLVGDPAYHQYRASTDRPVTIPNVQPLDMAKLWRFEQEYDFGTDASYRNLAQYWKTGKKVDWGSVIPSSDREGRRWIRDAADLVECGRMCYIRSVKKQSVA